MAHLITNLLAPGYSHVKGPEDTPLLTETIYELFERHAKRSPERMALAAPEQSLQWNYFFLKRRCDRAAIGLAELGFEKGDRMGVWMFNNHEWLVMQLATAKLGVILVNVNPDYRLPELEFALNLVGCKGLVMVPKFMHSNAIEMIQTLCPELGSAEPVLKSARVPSLRYVIVTDGGAQRGMISFDELYKDSQATIRRPGSCTEPINIQFTSGTTGKPKATTLTHEGILNNAYFVGRTMHYSADEVICVPVPLYHCFGCVMGNLAFVAFGCSLVYPASKFDPLKTLKAVTTYKCTSLYGVPTMFISLLDHPEFLSFKISTLRTGVMGGALCPMDTMQRVIADMGAKELTIAYGMTETSPISWQTRIGTPLELTCTTVGQIHPHVECIVVDPESLQVLPCNMPGELWTAGYGVMQSYWDNEKATSEAVVSHDGKRWMRTGDLATISDAGFCQIVGRIKDMILRGGENIFPKEIEEPLIAHPKIVNASVIGVPDSRLGEQVCAWISWKGGKPLGQRAQEAEEEIRSCLKDNVAHFKIPKYILFKDEFPMTVTGKIRKVEMRELSIKELGLEAHVENRSRL